jgi:hypothetical protein
MRCPAPSRRPAAAARARGAAALWALVALAACPEAPPLSIEVDPATLEADGVGRARVTVRARDPIEGAVVQLTASGGALTSSTAALVDGVAVVELTAPLERELGRREARTLDLLAFVALGPGGGDDRLEAATQVRAVPPQSGPPLLFLDAAPPAAVAGSGARVTLDVVARRLPAGAQLSLTTTAGALVASSVTLDADGTGQAALTAPATPADAEVVVTDATTGASARVVVRFVAAGEPLYDLSGAFAQLGPARVKLVSGALTPNPQCAIAPSVVLAQFVQRGLDVEARYTTCEVTFPPVTSIVGTVTNLATPAFYAAIPVVSERFALPGGELGARYAPPPSVVVVGATLEDPAREALPTEENDPRVVDADEDGAPGVTVQNSLGGAQRIVFRNVGTSAGRVLSSNHIVGDVPGDLLAVTETSVFGIGGAFLPDTFALGSVVELVRVDGRYGALDADADRDGAVSCAELLDVAGSIVTLEPPDTPFDCGEER